MCVVVLRLIQRIQNQLNAGTVRLDACRVAARYYLLLASISSARARITSRHISTATHIAYAQDVLVFYFRQIQLRRLNPIINS